MAVLLTAIVATSKASLPIAVLRAPVVAAESLRPTATLLAPVVEHRQRLCRWRRYRSPQPVQGRVLAYGDIACPRRLGTQRVGSNCNVIHARGKSVARILPTATLPVAPA